MISIWKKSLVLLAVTASRRDVVIAFVQTSFIPSTTTCSTSSLRVVEGADRGTSPLGDLIDLGGCPTNGKDNKDGSGSSNKSPYQLVSPDANEIPLVEGQRLVCIGDVHGDFEALETFLSIADVYCKDSKENQEWTGGNTILVQCGDVLDRGTEELKCFDLLTRLSQQAEAAGGAVVLLWGNHEALNAGGQFHYTTGGDTEYEAAMGSTIDDQLNSNQWRVQYAGNQPARWATYEPGSGILAHPLMSRMKVAVKVGKTVCVHAGLTASHLDQYGGLKGMNEDAQQWMKKSYMKNNNFAKYANREALVADVNKRAQVGSSTMPSVLGGGSGEKSPVWMRDYSDPADQPPKNPKAQQMIDATLFHLQADRMVMGHTVQRGINVALKDKAWRVDVGASKGVMNGTPEVLEVAMKDGKEVVSVLTNGGRVPANERRVEVSITLSM